MYGNCFARIVSIPRLSSEQVDVWFHISPDYVFVDSGVFQLHQTVAVFPSIDDFRQSVESQFWGEALVWMGAAISVSLVAFFVRGLLN